MRRVIRKHIRRRDAGVNIAADVDAVIAANTGTPGQTTVSRSTSTQRVVQDSRSERDAPDDARRGKPEPDA